MVRHATLPLPRIALRVGITGHRPARLAGGIEAAVAASLTRVLTDIDALATTVTTPLRGHFYADEPADLRIVSGLAEGADRMAIDAAPLTWGFEAVLPMRADDYRRDFSPDAGRPTDPDATAAFDALLGRARTVTELEPPDGTDLGTMDGRAGCYRALGLFLVRQIDLLVAVWDGADALGPGGTAEVVALADKRGLPVIWIDVADPAQPRIATGAGAHADGPLHWAALSRPALANVLAIILKPPVDEPASKQSAEHGHAKGHTHGHDHAQPTSPRSQAGAPAWFGDPWPQRLYAPFAYTLLRRLAGAGRWSWPLSYGTPSDLARSWDGFLAGLPPSGRSNASAHRDPDLDTRLRTHLLPHSIWADALAWAYGLIYRSAYVTSFLLAGLSVPIGLCYLYFLDRPDVLDIKAAFVCVELVIILTVVAVVKAGDRQQWHAVWLETRELSELLRQGRTLAVVGGLRDFLPVSSMGEPETISCWYARAVFRGFGLFDGVLTSAALRQTLSAVLATEIVEQRDYHLSNARNLRRIQHFLHHTGTACFNLTIAFLLVYLLVWGLDHAILAAHAEGATVHEAAHAPEGVHHGMLHEVLEFWIKPAVSIAAAGLPAFGAALSGIGAQGDFEGFATRSASTRAELIELQNAIAALLADEATIDLETATAMLRSVTSVMTRDVSRWRQLYLAKRLTLPA